MAEYRTVYEFSRYRGERLMDERVRINFADDEVIDRLTSLLDEVRQPNQPRPIDEVARGTSPE